MNKRIRLLRLFLVSMWNFQGVKFVFPSARFCALGYEHVFFCPPVSPHQELRVILGFVSPIPPRVLRKAGHLGVWRRNRIIWKYICWWLPLKLVYSSWFAVHELCYIILSCHTWDVYTSVEVCQEREARTEMPWHVWSTFCSVCCLKDMYALAWVWISCLTARSAANRCSAKIFIAPQKTSTARRCIEGP